MQGWAERLARHGSVHSFDYPYMAQGKRRPDPLPKLVEAHLAAMADARRGEALVLVGKSMGGRVGCHVAVEQPSAVCALVCFGYPLIGAGKTKKRRDQVLRALTVPVLFVQGDRDVMCPLDELDRVRREMSAASELHVIAGGNHSLEVGKRQLKARGETQADVDDHIEAAVADFLSAKARG
jgi:hypothetical protein